MSDSRFIDEDIIVETFDNYKHSTKFREEDFVQHFDCTKRIWMLTRSHFVNHPDGVLN